MVRVRVRVRAKVRVRAMAIARFGIRVFSTTFNITN